MTLLGALRRALRAIGIGLVALVIFVEEWGWKPLTALAAWLARLPLLARLETLIRRAPPRLALLLFMVPAVTLFPVKLGALWLIDQGRAGLGVAVILLAKVIGTALVGRLFILLERQLLSFAWFARILGWWHDTKARVLASVRRSAPWRAVRRWRRSMRAWARRTMHG